MMLIRVKEQKSRMISNELSGRVGWVPVLLRGIKSSVERGESRGLK